MLAELYDDDSAELEALLRSDLNTGGSGRGMSFWATADECGKQALLYEQRTAEWLRDPQRIPAFDPLKKTAFAVGGVYHKFQELWRRGRLPADWQHQATFNDASVLAAANLFAGYQAHFDVGDWGNAVAIEETLSIQDIFTDADGKPLTVNAKPDLVVDLSVDDLSDLSTDRGLDLPSHGRYMIDFKTAGSKYPVEYYAEGLQSYWYPAAYNHVYPDDPVIGIIFDIIEKPNARAKDQMLTSANFPTPVFVPSRPLEDVIDVLQGMITQGSENIRRAEVRNLGNRSKCYTLEFGQLKPCPFLHRACQGY